MLALGTLVVAEEGEPALVQPLEQQHPAMRTAVGIDGGQGHGIGLDRGLFGFHRIGKPLFEQAEWLDRRLRLAQAITDVVAAHIGQGLGHDKALENGSCLAYPEPPDLA
ncbi:hypothetical protein D3C71_1932820 [compost metagenome]